MSDSNESLNLSTEKEDNVINEQKTQTTDKNSTNIDDERNFEPTSSFIIDDNDNKYYDENSGIY